MRIITNPSKMEIKDTQEEDIKKTMENFRKKVEEKLGDYSIIAFDFFYILDYYKYIIGKSFSLSVDCYREEILPPFIKEFGSLGNFSNLTDYELSYRSQEMERLFPVLIFKPYSTVDAQKGKIGQFHQKVNYLKNKGFGNSCFWRNFSTQRKNGRLNISLFLVFQKQLEEKDVCQLKSLILDEFISVIFDVNEDEWIRIVEQERNEYEVNKKHNERVEAHRHTLFNLLNAIESQRSKLDDNDFGLLKNGAEFALAIMQDICSSSETERHQAWEKFAKTPKEILYRLIKYFKGNKYARMNLESFLEESNLTLKPIEVYSYFTIMYNLIHNAEKSRGYETWNKNKIYTVKSFQSENSYITEIITPAIMPDEIIEFINNINRMNQYERFDFDNTSFIKKKTKGIAISNRLAIENDWILKVENDNNHLQNTITLVIPNIDINGIN